MCKIERINIAFVPLNLQHCVMMLNTLVHVFSCIQWPSCQWYTEFAQSKYWEPASPDGTSTSLAENQDALHSLRCLEKHWRWANKPVRFSSSVYKYVLAVLVSNKWEGFFEHLNQSCIKPSIYFSLIAKSHLNLFLEPTSTKQCKVRKVW